MDKDISDKVAIDFLKVITKLTPEQFIGLAKLMDINVLSKSIDKETKKAIPKDVTEILDEMIDIFGNWGRPQRRFVVKRLKKMVKEGITLWV